MKKRIRMRCLFGILLMLQMSIFISNESIDASTYVNQSTISHGAVTHIYVSYHGDLVSGEIQESDFYVMVVYQSGAREIVNEFTLSTHTLNVGQNRILVTVEGKSTIVTLYVPNGPSKLVVSMNKNEYMAGTTLTTSDFTVVATLADGSTQTIDRYQITNATLRQGNNSVTISYEGISATIDVEGKQSCTITYDTVGGNVLASKQVISGQEIGELPVPEKKQYEFAGWYFDDRYTRKCTSSNKLASNVTLFAKWQEDQRYKISSSYINIKPYGQDSVHIPGATVIRWDCDDWNIASIDSDGIITGIHLGTTKITAYTSDGYELTCIVTVGTQVKELIVPKKKITIKKGQTYEIQATVTPSNAVTKQLLYTSSNKNLATVTKRGVIRAMKKGTCIITIQTTDSSHKSKTIQITVK